MARPRLLTALILATAFLADGALAQMPPRNNEARKRHENHGDC